MNVCRPKFTWKKIFLPLVGLAAFFLYILLFNVDILEIVAKAGTANPLIFSAAITVSLAEVFFYALSWRSILNYLQVKISIIRSFLFVWYGTYMDIIIPAESISGEVCRVYLVNREQCGTSGKVVASVVTQRLIGMSMNVSFLIAGMILLFNTKVDPLIFNLILFFTVAIAAVLVLMLLLISKDTWSRKVITSIVQFGNFITRRRWKRLRVIEEEALKNAVIFHSAMKEFFQHPQSLIFPIMLLAINWLCSLSVPYLVFQSLGFEVPWSIILVTGSIVVAIKSVPIGIPFEVGPPEIAMTTLYTLMNVPAGLSATATILSRIITLWLRFGIGFVSQQWVELKPPINLEPSLTKKTKLDLELSFIKENELEN